MILWIMKQTYHITGGAVSKTGAMRSYKSYPQCPECENKGPLVEEGMRQCLKDGCQVQVYWRGGVSTDLSMNDPIVQEKEYHFNKERIMSRAFEKYIQIYV